MVEIYMRERIPLSKSAPNYDIPRLEDELRAADPRNKRYIIRFYKQCVAEGLATSSIRKYIFDINIISRTLGKDFRKADKSDIIDLCVRLEGMKGGSEKKIVMKKFYKIIEGGGERYPAKVRWIHVRNCINRKLPESILKENDIRDILDVCGSIRERSFVAMLYLSGCRSSELLNLRTKDMCFDEKGVTFLIRGTKTPGSRRPVRVMSGIDLLMKWLKEHPDPGPESLVWMMDYWSCHGLFQKLRRRLNKKGIVKHVHAHALRAARATHLADNGWNTFQLMQFFGWSKPDTALWYITLSNKQIEDALSRVPDTIFSHR